MSTRNGEMSPSPGESKMKEYAERIQAGEPKESILKDLPPSFQQGIERHLNQAPKQDTMEAVPVMLPPQYTGMRSEAVDIVWVIPEYLDPEKTQQEKDRKANALQFLRKKETISLETDQKERADQSRIAELRGQLGISGAPDRSLDETDQTSNEYHAPSKEERMKLSGWPASYELAKIAQSQGIDLARLQREEYAQFAILNSLAIDDSQLRAAPWQRMGTSVEAIVVRNKEESARIQESSEKTFSKFCFDTKQMARSDKRILRENIRVRQGTKDDDSWLFFGINNYTSATKSETYKSYISVNDLNTLTPERFISFMESLRDAGYQGNVKIFQDLTEQGPKLNDQIVMHGNSRADSILALQVAEKFFGADLNQKSFGKDEIIDGKKQSYSQILARKIGTAIRNSQQ